ncbi:MAG: hypothetical protein COS34_04675 [Lysobacterales bacterium CG02_land_8_20_14_3_00_62_12]|nr:MAG: hypothetical protein COS34_04675 [Xanthomonadales bacterium CG02_land_8_20_14_3_00_62_12]
MQNHANSLFFALMMIGPSPIVLADDVHADTQSGAATAQAGMRAYVDPATGKLVSQPVTAEQKRQATTVDPAFSQDSSDLRVVQMPDGSTMMDLQGRFQQATVVAKQSDGSLSTYCNDADHLTLGTHRHEPATSTVDRQPVTSPEER